MPVGTAATVKALTPRDLREAGAQIILANTYHLWLRPGRETLVAGGGLHRFMAWDGPILTDSGGYQVFSLESRRDARRRRGHVPFAYRRQQPPVHARKRRSRFRKSLGVDIAMVLDECIKLPASAAAVDDSVRRTSAVGAAGGRRLAARPDRAVRDRAGRRWTNARACAARPNSSPSTSAAMRSAVLSVGETRDGDGAHRRASPPHCCPRRSRAISWASGRFAI